MIHPASTIFILNLLCGMPISYYLATTSCEPRLTFIIVNVLCICVLALWFQKDMWKTMATWLVEDKYLAQEIALLQEARWQAKRVEMDRRSDDEIAERTQRELRAAEE